MQGLQSGKHPGVGGLGRSHHVVEEELGVEFGQGRRGVVLAAGKGVEGRVLLVLGQVEGFPEVLAVQVGAEAGEEGGVHWDAARLEAVEEAVGFGGADAVVYPAWRDAEGEFVV